MFFPYQSLDVFSGPVAHFPIEDELLNETGRDSTQLVVEDIGNDGVTDVLYVDYIDVQERENEAEDETSFDLAINEEFKIDGLELDLQDLHDIETRGLLFQETEEGINNESSVDDIVQKQVVENEEDLSHISSINEVGIVKNSAISVLNLLQGEKKNNEGVHIESSKQEERSGDIRDGTVKEEQFDRTRDGTANEANAYITEEQFDRSRDGTVNEANAYITEEQFDRSRGGTVNEANSIDKQEEDLYQEEGRGIPSVDVIGDTQSAATHLDSKVTLPKGVFKIPSLVFTLPLK